VSKKELDVIPGVVGLFEMSGDVKARPARVLRDVGRHHGRRRSPHAGNVNHSPGVAKSFRKALKLRIGGDRSDHHFRQHHKPSAGDTVKPPAASSPSGAKGGPRWSQVHVSGLRSADLPSLQIRTTFDSGALACCQIGY
jgi:hypothetical protein